MTKLVPEVQVGDFVFEPTAKGSTVKWHDDPLSQDRGRLLHEDADAALLSEGAPAPGEEVVTPTAGEVAAAADIDASIADARARAQPEQVMPIFLFDPVTGKPAGTL